MFEKEAEEYESKLNKELPHDEYGQVDYHFYDIQETFQEAAEFGYNKGKEEMINIIKLLITTLDATTWSEGALDYSDSEAGYNCPNCDCKDCYRVSCKYNKSEIFKQLYQDFPELQAKEVIE